MVVSYTCKCQRDDLLIVTLYPERATTRSEGAWQVNVQDGDAYPAILQEIGIVGLNYHPAGPAVYHDR